MGKSKPDLSVVFGEDTIKLHSGELVSIAQALPILAVMEELYTLGKNRNLDGQEEISGLARSYYQGLTLHIHNVVKPSHFLWGCRFQISRAHGVLRRN